MRRSRMAMIAAVSAVALSASILQAQMFGRRSGTARDRSADPAAMTANIRPATPSRGVRQLLRNGLDYLDHYGDPERALSYLREAEGRRQELNPTEQRQLADALARAGQLLAGHEVGSDAAHGRAIPGAIAQAQPLPQPSTEAYAPEDAIQRVAAEAPEPLSIPNSARPALPADRDLLAEAPAPSPEPVEAPAPLESAPVPPLPASEVAAPVESPADSPEPATAPAGDPIGLTILSDPSDHLDTSAPAPDLPATPTGMAPPLPGEALEPPPALPDPGLETPAPPESIITTNEPEPIAEPEPVTEQEPAVEPEPAAEPEPATEPEPVTEPEPITEPEPAIEAPDDSEPDPSVIRQSESGVLLIPPPPRVPEAETPAPVPEALPALPAEPDPAVAAPPSEPLPGSDLSVDPVPAASADLPPAAPADPPLEVAADQPTDVPVPETGLDEAPVLPLPDDPAAAPMPAEPAGGPSLPPAIPMPEAAPTEPPLPAGAEPPLPVPDGLPAIDLSQAISGTDDPAAAASATPMPAPRSLARADDPRPRAAEQPTTPPLPFDTENAAITPPAPEAATPPASEAEPLPPLPVEATAIPPRESSADDDEISGTPAPLDDPSMDVLPLNDLPPSASTLRPETLHEIQEIARRQDEESRRNPRIYQPGASLFGEEAGESSGSRINLPRAPSPTEARPIKPVPVPEEFEQLGPRVFTPNRKYWAAAATPHMPLYFQDAVLERYGQSVEQSFGPAGRFFSYPLDDPKQSTQRMQLLQPLYSAGMFVAQIVALPYNVVMDPPWEAQYDLGYFRPGDPVPPDLYYLPAIGLGPPLHGNQYGRPREPRVK